jgi:hypothetical protein
VRRTAQVADRLDPAAGRLAGWLRVTPPGLALPEDVMMDVSTLGDFGELGFPLWVRLTHWFNALFLLLLARSGLAILAAHPKLYWNVDCRPGQRVVAVHQEDDAHGPDVVLDG